MLKCPVCGKVLEGEPGRFVCENRHSFDRAANGYVNLLLPNRGAGNHGDSKEMLRARRSFLEKGYYANLSGALCRLVLEESRRPLRVLDCCCGEGYYTNALRRALEEAGAEFILAAFDISKNAARMAASKENPVQYFAASVFDIPVEDGWADIALHSFAPYCDAEIARVLSPGGLLFGVLPGRRHLYGLKEVLYDRPYENDETGYESERLKFLRDLRLCGTIHLACPEDIQSLFWMTPYCWRTPEAGVKRMQALAELHTETEFLIRILQKPE